jgi:hypothetical protein
VIYANPSTSTEVSATGFATGLVGTIGVRVLDGQGGVTLARRTTGIIEDPAGSGIYVATFTSPSVTGRFTVVWDSGGASPSWAAEDLTVTYQLPDGTPSTATATYATPTQLRDYTGDDFLTLPDTEALRLLAKAERDIDSLAPVDRPVSEATGLRFDPTSLSGREALILQRATCAQAEYRREMGDEFFIRGQYEEVTGPEFSTKGKLGLIGPATWRELRGNGFIRLTTTTKTSDSLAWRPQPDFTKRRPREEFELG